MIDLHIHSTYSDGIHSPEEIVKIANRKKLKAISITDHDTIEGTKRVLDEKSIKVISGVEISTWHENTQLHILGYGIDVKNKYLLDKIKYLRLKRESRAEKIISKLNKQGIDLKKDDIEYNKVIARPNIARAMIKKGYIKDISQAFNKYLGSGGSAFVPKTLFTFEQSVNMIKRAGGVAVLAHPGEIKTGNINYWLKEAVNRGVKGVEVFHPSNDKEVRKLLLEFAGKNNLLITGGSDCHGKPPKKELGIENIPDHYFKELKNSLNI